MSQPFLILRLTRARGRHRSSAHQGDTSVVGYCLSQGIVSSFRVQTQETILQFSYSTTRSLFHLWSRRPAIVLLLLLFLCFFLLVFSKNAPSEFHVAASLSFPHEPTPRRGYPFSSGRLRFQEPAVFEKPVVYPVTLLVRADTLLPL